MSTKANADSSTDFWHPLTLFMGLGIFNSLPFWLHPDGLNRDDGWLFSIFVTVSPVFLLLWLIRKETETAFLEKIAWNWSRSTLGFLWKTWLLTMAASITLLIVASTLDLFEIDWTFLGFEQWVSQIFNDFATKQNVPIPPLPGKPSDFAGWTLLLSLIAPMIFWISALPQEMLWRGWLFNRMQVLKPPLKAIWMNAVFWSLYHLPHLLLQSQDPIYLLMKILYMIEVGWLLGWLRIKSQSIIPGCMLVATVLATEPWGVILQSPNNLEQFQWIRWDGWLGQTMLTIIIARLHQNLLKMNETDVGN